MLNPTICDQTVNTTPVPVAHSTVTRRNKQRSSVNPYSPVAAVSPIVFVGSKTYTIPEQMKPTETDENEEEQTSILNLDNIKGLSGGIFHSNVLPEIGSKISDAPEKSKPLESDHLRGLSVEEFEAEGHSIKIDDDELQLLEDAFSDLDCCPTELTIPTKACATTAPYICVTSPDVVDANNGTNDSATTISSLHSILDHSKTNQAPDVKVERGKVIKDENDVNADALVSSTSAEELPVGDAQYKEERITTRPIIHDHCATRTKTVLNPIKNHQVDLDETDSYSRHTSSMRVSSVSTPEEIGKETGTSSHYPNAPMNPKCDRIIGSKTVLQQKPDSTQQPCTALLAPRNFQKFSINPGTTSTESSLHDSTPTPAHVSCLHLSDVDFLLDMIRDNTTFTENNSPILHYNKKLIAKQRTARLNPSTLSSVPEGSLHPSPALSSYSIESRTYKKPSTTGLVKDNSAHLEFDNANQKNVTTVSCGQGASLSTPSQPDATTSHISTSRQNTIATSRTYDQIPSSSPPSQSSFLSNANCLIFCGTSCGQIQRQQLLIKHQMDGPITVKLTVSPGGDVFKLTDERGYLLSGSHVVHLPPGLEYAIHVGYAAHHPLTWDTGHLRVSLENVPKRSVWKVRLIGYSDCCQLECSCCNRLSSELYWTTALRVPPPMESQLNRTSPAAITVSNSANIKSASNCFISCVVLTNFGARAAWVSASVDPLAVGPSRTDRSSGDLNSTITVEPSRMVIGPKQSQKVVVKMKDELTAARIIFFHGDEVLRHQVRQHYILPRQSPHAAPNHNRHHHRVKVADLMVDFENETPFQLVELPTQLRDFVRPEDWYQALNKQLHLREHFVLNVYAPIICRTSDTTSFDKENVSPQQNSVNKFCPVVSPEVPTLIAREDVFTRKHRSSTIMTDRTITENPSTPDRPCYTVLTIEPNDKLPFPVVLGNGTSEGQLRIVLPELIAGENMGNTVWTVEGTLRPSTNVLLIRPDLSTTRLDADSVFVPKGGRTFSLTLTGQNHSTIDFIFHPPSTEALYRQDWQIRTWVKCFKHQKDPLKAGVEQARPHIDSNSVQTLAITLEGKRSQCTSSVSNVNKLDPVCGSVTEVKPTVDDLQNTGNQPRDISCGPLLIRGLPTHFQPVGLLSDSELKTSDCSLQLYNRSKENTVFLQLELPKAPFHLVKPTQTRFRILPKHLVHLKLTYRPTEIGTNRSVMRIRVTALASCNQLGLDARSEQSYHAYEMEIPLSGQTY